MKLERFGDVVDYVQRYEFVDGPDKTSTMEAAVRTLVRPGAALHVGITHAFPYAACSEIARQFWRKDPAFTVYSLGAVNHIIIWLHGGMIKKLVTSYCGDIYPAPGPNPAFNDAWLSGELTIKNWTVLTYSLRMMAGALGWPFVPTRSLIGSSMEADNGDELKVVDAPDGSRVALLSPIRPDLSIYHAWAADKFGNAVFTPPYSENLWGAMAAREGAIITAERIVDTDFIKHNSAFARLPGQYVRAVVHAPMGAHPGGFNSAGLDGLEGYAEDYDFIVEFRRANRKPDHCREWLQEWVLGVNDHGDYLRKLGSQKVALLKGRASPESWKGEIADFEKNLPDSAEWNPLEFMTVAAARELASKARVSGYKMLLAGQGNSNLAAWMARYALAAEGVRCDLVAETGFFGYAPRPGSPFLFNFSNIPACTALSDAVQTLGAFVCGGVNDCLASLSAGQVDRHGNVNSTCIPGVFFLVGSGGANDVASTAKELVITLPMSQMRCLESVPYITAPGRAVTTIVTDRGVLRRAPDGEFELCRVLDRSGTGLKIEELVAAARENCGWDLRVAPGVAIEPAPTVPELKLLRSFDPRRSFTGDT